MSLKKEEPKCADIPDVVYDPSTQKRYLKGRFLGKVCVYVCVGRMFIMYHSEKVTMYVVVVTKITRYQCSLGAPP